MKHTTHKLAAVMTAAATTLMGTDSYAATNLTTVADNLTSSSEGVPRLMSAVAYMGGSALGLAGIFKLKQHVDNPGQTKVTDALSRLASGGALLSFPMIASAMQGSVSDDDNNGVAATDTKIDSNFDYGN